MPRAVLQTFLFGEENIAAPGTGGIEELLWTELCNNTAEPLSKDFYEIEAPQDPRHQAIRIIDQWQTQAAVEYVYVLRSLCQNRCRARRCLTNVLQNINSFLQQVSMELHLF